MLYSKAVNFLNETDSIGGNAKMISVDRMVEEQKPATILRRIAARDKTAVAECLNKHGSLIWALAKQFTASHEEAEAATQEIFLDLWKCAERFDSAKCEETDFIVLITRRWLIKRKLQLHLASRTNSETPA